MAQRGRKSAAALATPAGPTLVTTAAGLEPPRPLGEHGRAVWDRITSTYDVGDPGSSEILAQACAAVDMAEACRADGDTKTELQARAFVARVIGRLCE